MFVFTIGLQRGSDIIMSNKIERKKKSENRLGLYVSVCIV